jgi:hypothetical protein
VKQLKLKKMEPKNILFSIYDLLNGLDVRLIKMDKTFDSFFKLTETSIKSNGTPQYSEFTYTNENNKVITIQFDTMKPTKVDINDKLGYDFKKDSKLIARLLSSSDKCKFNNLEIFSS